MPTSSISCPNCGYSKNIQAANLPQKPATVSCPSCKNRFLYTPPVIPGATSPETAIPEPVEPKQIHRQTPVRTSTKSHNQPTSNSNSANGGLAIMLLFVLILLGLAGGRIWLDARARAVPFPQWLATSEQGVAVLYGNEFFVVNFNGDIKWTQKLPAGAVPCQISWHDDEVWVSDWENDSILQFKGDQMTTIPLNGPAIGAHLNIAVDKTSGNFFISDSQGSRIATYNPDGDFINAFGQAGPFDGQLLSPKDIAFDDDGLLIIGNTLRPAVDAFRTDGTFVKTLTVPKGKPGYIFLTDFAIDQNNLVTIECNMLVSDCVVAAYDHDGRLLNTQPQPPAEAAGDVAIWDGTVYVSDCLNRRVLAYDAQTLESLGFLSIELNNIGINFNKEFSFYKLLSKLSLVLIAFCFIPILWVYIRSKKNK